MIQALEELVRGGQFAEAKKLLGTIRLRGLARADALRVANIARRVHDFRLALTILNPIVRSSLPASDPTSQEKIEYAESLRKLGAVNEAQTMLKEIDAEIFPEVLMGRAFCHFSKWEYREAIPLLKAFAKNKKAEPYRLRVAQLNLAAAHVFLEEISEAELLLNELRAITETEKQDLLRGNTLELSAQLALQKNQPEEAMQLLNLASGILSKVNGVDLLFVEKWKAVTALRLEGLLPSKQALPPRKASPSESNAVQSLKHVRAQAVEVNHWETVRDCDFYLSLATGSEELWNQVYFGTPFASYRVKALSRALKTPPGERHHVRTWSATHGRELSSTLNQVVDVESGALLDSAQNVTAQLPESQLLHRLLISLTRDSYRPLPLLEVFGALFNDEFYNPKSSPNRVHQAVKKFRQWLKESNADLELNESEGSYQLLPGPDTSIRVPREPLSLDQNQILNDRVHRALFDRATITARELALLLDVSLATAKRLLVRTAKSGSIELVGAGPSAHYRKLAG